MKKRIFKRIHFSYIFALVIGALFMIKNVNAETISSDLKLTSNRTESIVVKSGSNITIDLNGFNITTTKEDSIIVENGATLNLKGKGTIEAIGTDVAPIYNNGTIIMSDATLLKDESKGTYYAILNHGIMTIKSGTVRMDNYKISSLIANGYYDYTNTADKVGKKAYIDGVGNPAPKLIIENGTFDGGRNTVKNDDAATLTINGGTYKNNVQVTVFNVNIATINGGTFETPTGNDKTNIVNKFLDDKYDKGILNINGGTFKALYLLEGWTKDTISITGGNYENISKTLINTSEERKKDSPKDNLNSTNVKISGGTFNSNTFYDEKYIKDGYEMFDYNSNIVVDKKAEFQLTKVKYYVEKGKTIKLDYTANETGKKYLNVGSADEKIATIKGDVINGVSVGKTNIDCFISGRGEPIEVIVYEVKTDNATKNETNNLNSLINEIANGKKEVKGLDKETSNKLLEAINNNKTITTELNTKEIKSSEVNKDTKDKVNKILKKEEKIAAYYDINVLLKVDNNSLGKITELNDSILVSVDVPNSLPELKTGHTRKYYIIRIHNGETTKLDANLVNGKIEFKTDKFSDYILTYTDEESESTVKGKLDDVPKTSFINYTIFFTIFGLMTVVTVKLLRKNN